MALWFIWLESSGCLVSLKIVSSDFEVYKWKILPQSLSWSWKEASLGEGMEVGWKNKDEEVKKKKKKMGERVGWWWLHENFREEWEIFLSLEL